MQLSAANLLIASQQLLLRAGTANPAAGAAAFAETLTKETGAAFEPMAFRKSAAAPDASTASPARPAAAASYAGATTPGMHLDIRV